MRSASIIFTTLIAVMLMGAGAARAGAICVTPEKMVEITTSAGMSIIFKSTPEEGVGYVIYAHPKTAEWIALRVSAKPSLACIMTNGVGYSIAAPEPTK